MLKRPKICGSPSRSPVQFLLLSQVICDVTAGAFSFFFGGGEGAASGRLISCDIFQPLIRNSKILIRLSYIVWSYDLRCRLSTEIVISALQIHVIDANVF